jgi:exopolyphosphatase/guanosine-5'-triphosphate,3'-diphosphate pyrophosphatase
MRVAIIDIGSNSVLLLVGERADSGWRILVDTARITRLGEGFSAEKMLQPQAIERTLQAIDEYLSICHALRVERVIAVATAVVREARNQEAFVDALRRRLPVSHADGFTSLPLPPQGAC